MTHPIEIRSRINYRIGIRSGMTHPIEIRTRITYQIEMRSGMTHQIEMTQGVGNSGSGQGESGGPAAS